MPTEEQALQFALMIQAGLAPSDAILYFVETEDPMEIAAILAKWMRSRAVKRASAKLLGKSWQEMTLDERIKVALDQTYAQMAYLLYSKHYGEVGQADKAKLDTARQALESKVAGTAGKGDALTQFFDDVRSGRLKLGTAPTWPPKSPTN